MAENIDQHCGHSGEEDANLLQRILFAPVMITISAALRMSQLVWKRVHAKMQTVWRQCVSTAHGDCTAPEERIPAKAQLNAIRQSPIGS